MVKTSRSFNTNPQIVRALMVVASVIVIVIGISFLLPDFFSVKSGSKHLLASAASSSATSTIEATTTPPAPVITHIKTPEAVKGVYMSSWVAGTPSIRSHVLNIINTTEVNSVVIDIKDYTGKIAFETNDPELNNSGCIEKRISDIVPLIQELHAKGVYVIGRVAVFQDPCFVKLHPEAAVKRSSDGGIWKDRKGISWMDAGSKEVWDHIIQIAKASYALGFDEINFDYIRFPSDGNMRDIAFPASGTTPKAQVIGNFFQYLDKELRGGRASSSTDPAFDELYASYASSSSRVAAANTDYALVDGAGNGRIVLSADLFGLVTVANDDLGIGQTLSHTLPYVDYIAPMVYPSHFADSWNGFKNPADHPYEVIDVSMSSAVKRAVAQGLNPQKLRPWLQDFNLKATYTPAMVRDQIKATYDAGLTSWLLWDPNNKYSVGALEK